MIRSTSKVSAAVALAFLAFASASNGRPLSGAPIAIVGATVIDVSNGGLGTRDIVDATVLMHRGRIVAIGMRNTVPVPANARVIDGRHRFLVPGLIDGFGAVRSQAFADAYLYEGVTTVYVPIAPPSDGLDGEARVVSSPGDISILTAAPISGYSRTGSIPQETPWVAHKRDDRPLDDAALVEVVDAAAKAGHRGVNVGFDVWPAQLRTIVAEAHRKGLVVTAELAFTDYGTAARAGVDAFIRNDKYELSLSGPAAFDAYSDDPIGGGGRAAFKIICASDDPGPGVDQFAAALRAAGTALMPALVMEATADDTGGPNPWSLPAAAFFAPSDLDDPVDPTTGARPYLDGHPDRREAIRACARRKADIDRRLHAAGARYLAGSSAPGFGVMPGSGLHVELKLLQGIGLTPREALATATGNFAEAYRWRDRGLIAAGRRADVLLLDSDPRIDIAAIDTIAAVVAGGKVVDRDLLRKRERQARTS